jgi:hypothetical protein
MPVTQAHVGAPMVVCAAKAAQIAEQHAVAPHGIGHKFQRDQTVLATDARSGDDATADQSANGLLAASR